MRVYVVYPNVIEIMPRVYGVYVIHPTGTLHWPQRYICKTICLRLLFILLVGSPLQYNRFMRAAREVFELVWTQPINLLRRCSFCAVNTASALKVGLNGPSAALDTSGPSVEPPKSFDFDLTVEIKILKYCYVSGSQTVLRNPRATGEV
jgi:hypothetical protein